ncbi:MAG: hypothetical protein A4E57_04725 [Syntrophorhabdaceae bacterium PtaU1.Bin034]|nr:MAG: hypothetical protein A4E57_04725 [Syntrophorhabdaceae bacterium PtaU1.Bin034]
MSNHVHLALPPNVARHVRAEFAARFPRLAVGAPDLHREMFDVALHCGDTPPPALVVSAYPQLIQNVLHFGPSRFATFREGLPPLRSELADLGLEPPCPELKVVAVIPCLMICNNDAVPEMNDWEDLCDSRFSHFLGTPPPDTPLPYLVAAFLRGRYGARALAPLSRLDTKSIPLDINKRVDTGELGAGVLIPAFGRSFRNKGARMIWPRSGAIAVPLIACMSSDAPEEAHGALAYLLSEEMQAYLALLGGLVPARAGTPGFPELDAAGWKLIWPGWNGLLETADDMTAALVAPDKRGEVCFEG